MLISNSEAKSFLDCERKHYYSFREALKPGRHGKALTRGIVGHEALEAYYAAKRDGQPKRDCLGFAQEILDNNIDTYPEFSKELIQLKSILEKYVEYYWDEPWKILEVESSYSMLLDNSTVEYGMRLDLLVEVTAGREKGQIQIVDHKYVYDFFTDREKQMNSQLLKYILTLRDNGIDVRKAVLNQIRYRQFKSPNPEMMFRRDPIVATTTEMQNFFAQYGQVANRIERLYRLDMPEHKRQTTMHIDKTTCGSCAFQPLCKLYLEGQDEERTKRVLYNHNEYIDQYRN